MLVFVLYSGFFRDVHPFETLRTSVRPALIARRSSERRLNLWCAATASGQEPYSVALLLAEYFPHLANWTMQFLANDISNELLTRAQDGCYSQSEVHRGLPEPLRLNHFHRHDSGWQIAESIRRRGTFRQLNLVQPWPHLPSMDLI
jgi:chemotaxis protein methyltransferase CheR